MAEIKSFPNNRDEFIGAEPFMRWFHGRTSGVFGAENNLKTTAVTGEMAVEVSDGIGWMSNITADGVVFWVDEFEKTGSKLKIPLDIGEPALNRIDRIVVSWQTTDYVALPTVSVLKGKPASQPTPPEITRSDNLIQIVLADVKVDAGVTVLTPSMVTDKRMDDTVCGIVNETIKIDTSSIQEQAMGLIDDLRNTIKSSADVANAEIEAFQTQATADFNAWFDTIKGQLNDEVATQLLALINTKAAKGKEFTVKIPTANWQGEKAPFTQTVNVEGMVADGFGFADLATYSKTEAQEYAKITDIDGQVGKIIFTAAEKKPMTDVNIIVRVVY